MNHVFIFVRDLFVHFLAHLWAVRRPNCLNKIVILCIVILVTSQCAIAQEQANHIIHGKVISNNETKPIPNAVVRILGNPITIDAHEDGRFSISVSNNTGILIASAEGYQSEEVRFNTVSSDSIIIPLNRISNNLDDVQVIGYGRVSKRLNTGSVVSIKSEDIEKQPVSNPIAALAGRVPGMTVTQENGSPGGSFHIQIRGQNSLTQGNQPLILIDGIPYQNQSISGVMSLANNGQSPMSNISPSDIASIEVLKDADATAIYGSRGANGVVLITTKQGKAGSTNVEISAQTGIGRINNKLDLLNTATYVAMRREAFANDNREITTVTAPDLTLWDTTRTTDWQEYLFGKTANFTNINTSISGGSTYTQFMISANYNKTGAVFPGNYADQRGTLTANINHQSADGRFKVLLNSMYGLNQNELPSSGMSQAIFLPPNNPSLLDNNGNLVWEENGGAFSNPLFYLKRNAHERLNRYIANINLSYEFSQNLKLRLTAGYSTLASDQMETNPVAAQNPNSSNLVSSADFANTKTTNWIMEPQLEYSKSFEKSNLSLLLGSTLQNENKNFTMIEASGFANDALIEAAQYATNVIADTYKSEYRYQAAFGRLNYNYDNKYIANLTGRIDGSSRFGPGRRVSNFGAVGLGYIFSEEQYLKDQLSWLSYGKLRGSYGVTGNDQIGDYQYLDNSQAVNNPYQNQIGYIPSRLYNEDYSWETNNKLEAAIELGFIENKLLLSANWFQNRSSSQLINYRLPDQTGFSSILRNFNALVENTGWELLASSRLVERQKFRWDLSANISISRNRLHEFPNLENSTYANTLVIGKPLNIIKALNYTGIDHETGLYTFDGVSRPLDQTVVVDLTPNYYGGISNDIHYGEWNISFLIQFAKQELKNHYATLMGRTPGTMFNIMTELYDARWMNGIDEATIQRLTSTTGLANTANSNFANYSDASYGDASFIRFKNIHISYNLPKQFVERVKLRQIKLFLQGQNLFTLTRYRGLDPETGAISLPPLQTTTFGFTLSF
ncbi:SusC/RagA family TonB-linked outer membrane protein [Sphingobacterium bambusae]|uniref:SusC/RagA family TonB-linked outer membrane protein n=1 Tax=Sphingobacterium bambusae TaxID=662858 RepID=A0ABW6BH80_9SPHI|nr:SusC/RagA family TonB-linked outer membrane protein [Sphingobacterium bambusae]WPL49412.1 SusC/RagA family TonB-linked outer membrane protein [Sphingobacterium bambusae]